MSMLYLDGMCIHIFRDHVWDSQKNSQAWGFSQNSTSQTMNPGNSLHSSFKLNSDFQNGPLGLSIGSDYWSQSQNVSQSLNEVIG